MEVMMFSIAPLGFTFARPKIYLTDSNTGQPVVNPNETTRSGGGDFEVRKNKRGKLAVVFHKGSVSRSGSAAGFADGKDEDQTTTQDVKKNKGGGDGKKNQQKAEEKKQGEAENEAGFTAEEDAKLTELKTQKNGVPWVKIAEQMGRPVNELQDRWKNVLKAQAEDKSGEDQGNRSKGDQDGIDKGDKQNKQGGGAGEGGEKKKGNDNQNSSGNNQPRGGKKGANEWSAEDDMKLKELWAADTGWSEMQTLLKTNKKAIMARWAEIGDSNKQSKDQGGKDKKRGPNADFTEDDDKLLKQLWAKGTSWKQLKKQLPGKSKDLIEVRWKEIGGDDTSKEQSKPMERKPEERKPEESKSEEPKPKEKKRDEAKREPSVKAASVKAPSVVSKARSHRSEARFTMSEWMTLSEDELFTFQELQLLSRIIMRDPSQSWLRVASNFHDKTGRRIHPDDIREKFEAMAAMG